MMRMLLVRGLLSGLVAGLVSVVFAYVFGEPSVGAAIDFESAAQGQTPDPELVSRGVQSTVGLATGVAVYAVAFGGLFAVAFAIAYGRLGRLGPRATAAVLAAGGYLATFVVPSLKYPANPPAASNPDTINERTAAFFAMVLASVVLAVAATSVARRLVPRLGTWNAAIAGILVYVATVGGAAVILPTVNEVPADFPATVLWNFRVASLGTQLTLWACMGLLFGALVRCPLGSGRVHPPSTDDAVA